MASSAKRWECKTKDVETALFNIQEAMQRTEDYVREHQQVES